MMKAIKENINTGHLITIAIFIIGMLASIVTMYYTVKFTGQNNTIQIQQLSGQVQNMNNKLENLDERYVRQEEFNQFRNNISDRLDQINNNVNYLIKLQVKRANNR